MNIKTAIMLENKNEYVFIISAPNVQAFHTKCS